MSGLSVPRRFTAAGKDPLGSMTMVRRVSRLSGVDVEVEVPDSWDQTATDILAGKYLRRAGVPQPDGTTGGEHSVRQVAHRMCHAWRMWGEAGGYFASPEDAQAFYDEMLFMVVSQMAAPNSPQWFNTGLFEAYGIVEDADGNWWWDPSRRRAVLSKHKFERMAASACYILGVDDRLVGDGSIMRHVENEARLFKAGSGSGANYSRIREAGGALSGGGTSSGLMSFLRVHDRAAGAIKSGGTTRRAAKMVIVDADHPDVLEFIDSKVKEEAKVAALIAAGFPSDFNGEAYDTVAFQNGNHSVRLGAGFMEALEADGDWPLLSRVDGSVTGTVKARDLWSRIASAAWSCADPGLQFDQTVNEWNTAAATERIRGSNPCSEYMYLDNTACNLASLNLVSFFDTDAQRFDVDGFLHAVRLWTIALEITVSASHYPTAEVAEWSFKHRTLGLGYANLGALLMRSGLPYDSDKARSVMGAVTALMHHGAWLASAELAAAVGPYEAFAVNRDSLLRVLANHRRAAVGSLSQRHAIPDFDGLSVVPQEIDHLTLAHTSFADLSERVVAVATASWEAVAQHGARNAQVTVLAPTGTIGLVMSCDTTGVEPDFALVKLKKLAGGGFMRITNASVSPALSALGYDSDAIARFESYLLGSRRFDDAAVNHASLAAAGLTPAEIDAAQRSLEVTGSLEASFERSVVGDSCFSRLGVDGSGAELLSALGFSAQQIVAADKHCCGHKTLEGAPGLRAEHLPVFDCAVECGDGTRTISWEGHVRALGAVSPHLSGAISKTVNMPADATADDVAAAHLLAYQLAVKCVAVYRDGSKYSQPLSSAKSSGDSDAGELPVVELAPREIPAGMSPSQFYQGRTPPRFRLPNMRMGPTWRFEIGGEEIYLRAGEYPDGTLGEIFIDWGKQGTTLRGITSSVSIAVSQALQHGVPLEKFVSAYRDNMFEPKGVVTGNDHLKMASSLMDAIVRILGHYYLGRTDLVQVPGGVSMSHAPAAAHPSASAEKPAGERVFGKQCADCGSHNMLRAGSCFVCGSCGTTTGCS